MNDIDRYNERRILRLIDGMSARSTMELTGYDITADFGMLAKSTGAQAKANIRSIGLIHF